MKKFLIVWLAGSLSLAFVTGLQAGAAEAAIWIEAEAPSRGNFPKPKDNPYRAKEFWETDVLSGGDWIGEKWTDRAQQPFLEYTFDAPEGGAFHLYVRKFFSFGNFRWRIDEGRWHEVDLTFHQPLDNVPLRETKERISLNWYYMGETGLSKGPHTLRVEPVYQERTGPDSNYNPLAYDVFLLTPEPWNPSGKLKPGARYDIQTDTAFSVEPPADPFQASPIDWRGLNEQVAGQDGGLAVKDGQIVFRDSGKPARLLAINMSLRAYANAGSTRFFARFLAKKGFNLARFDLVDVTEAVKLDSGEIAIKVDRARLRRLLDAIAALKENGIYTALTWHVSNTKDLASEVWDAPKTNEEGVTENIRHTLTSLLYFDKDFQKNVHEVWRTVLNSEIPKTGERLGADPAVAFLTLNQQESIFTDAFTPYEAVPAGHMPAIETAFAQWLVTRYEAKPLAEILAGWDGKPVKGDAPDEGRIGILSVPEIAKRHDARALDTARFLAETQAGFYAQMLPFVKDDLKFSGIVSTSNKQAASAPELGWINAWSQVAGDVTERHGNFLPYFEQSFNVWDAAMGAKYQDRSALRFDPLPGQESLRFELPLRTFSYNGKPVVFSEVSWPTPNRFRSEMPLLATTLASLQQVRVLGFNSIGTTFWQTALSRERTPFFTPATMGQMPAFAFAFRNGLLPEGPVVTKLTLSEASTFSLKPAALSENPDTQLDVALSKSPEPTTQENRPDPLLWTTGRTNVTLGGDKDKLTLLENEAVTDETITAGSVKWDYANGLFLVDAPSCKAVGGFLNAAGPITLDGVEFESNMEYGVLCVVALDGKRINSSAKILVQVFSEEDNSGSYAEGSPLKTIRSVGRPPILIKNLSGSVRFSRPDADALIATALDANGYKTLTAGIGGDLKLLPSTMYYLIEK